MKKKITISILIIIVLLSALFLYIMLFANIAFLGKRWRNNASSINLTNLPIDTDNSWEDSLGKFNHLKRVIIKDKTISIEKKLELQKKYPNITFDVIGTSYIQGELFSDDTDFIEITNPNINENIIEELSYFPKLKRLKLPSEFHDKNIELQLKDKYPNIFFNWNVEITDKIVSSTTTKLNLTNAVVNNVDDFRNSLKLLPKLEYLDLSDSNLDNETLYSLRLDFPNIKIVWTIKISVWKIKTDQVAFSVLIKNFPYYPITTKDLELFKYCTDLQALDLGHQNIEDLTPIGEYLPNLRVLIVADNPIKDLTPLAKLKHLHYLEVFMTNTKDISPLVNNKELVDLNISNTYIRDISPLIENDFPNLERIWMSALYIKKADLETLTKKYPNAEIINIGSGSTDFGWRTHERYYAMIDMFNKKDYISESFTKYDSQD